MTFAEQIKTRAYWLRFVAIFAGMVLLIGAIALVAALVMSPTIGPWIVGGLAVACVARLAYDVGRDQ